MTCIRHDAFISYILCASMYIFVRASARVCMLVCVCVCVCARARVNPLFCRLFVCVCVCVHVWMCVMSTRARLCVFAHACAETELTAWTCNRTCILSTVCDISKAKRAISKIIFSSL